LLLAIWPVPPGGLPCGGFGCVLRHVGEEDAGRYRRGNLTGLTRQDAREVLDIYIQAWEEQDPDLIVTIFTDSATYHERVLEEPIPDREAIRRYWQEKVVRSQANIKCELLKLYLDGITVIAEWEAEFDDVVQGVHKRMREIAVLVFEGHLIASLREYWASETVGQSAGRDPERGWTETRGLTQRGAADNRRRFAYPSRAWGSPAE